MNGRRKTVKRFHEPGDCQELTLSCDRRIPLLTNDDWRHFLAESLDHAVHGQSCRLERLTLGLHTTLTNPTRAF
jgi:hypothetical protein